MRILLIFVVLLIIAPPAGAQYGYGNDVYVRGHLERDGSYVQPHHRTAPDGMLWNNYSTQGNINPWTGQKGYVNRSQQKTNPYCYPTQSQRKSYSWP